MPRCLFSCLFFFASFVNCSHTKSNGAKEDSSSVSRFQGTIKVSFRMYENVDSSGEPTHPVKKEAGDMLNTERTMYIYDSLLVDVDIVKNFHQGVYTGNGGTRYTFYNLRQRQYMVFDSLTADAKALGNKNHMDSTGTFSKVPAHDPANGLQLGELNYRDTIEQGKTIRVATIPMALDRGDDYEFARRLRFQMDPTVKHFPIQLSYVLSHYQQNAFVYKMQMPTPNGQSVYVTTLDYQAKQLDKALVTVMQSWQKRLSLSN
ncbi:hypothetical protein LZZ85_12895 [Terrimonas sp. NA20]|uniref:Lipoprotein n=1 Tax=Terrimonas ginsenosidimutans TaxID=2908004 RepID=A0ABS9KSA7_9BACT|nr:hypothetical protein [Terrimonas ginsenosidimutans]MCG2615190.1 hypothetical protein [Terrimonas ginsenosidimutans]